MLHLNDQGISIIPLVDYGKLGLEKYRVFFKMSDLKLSEDVKPFFGGLHQSAGLTYYGRSMLHHTFDCEFQIPNGSRAELARLFELFEEMKLIQETEIHKVQWKDILMAKTQFFDFSSGEWDVDFRGLAGDPSVKIPSTSEVTRFDYNDLVIVKELQINSWTKVVDIAEKTRIPERDVAYHLNKHVLGRKLVPGFRFKWVGTKEAWAKHSVFVMNFMFRGISSEEVRHAMSIFTAHPFTWNHMLSDDGIYLAETLIPIMQLPETTRYLSERLRSVGLVPSETYFPDWNCVSNFTVPYTLYDQTNRAWKFNAETALEYTLQSVKAYSA